MTSYYSPGLSLSYVGTDSLEPIFEEFWSLGCVFNIYGRISKISCCAFHPALCHLPYPCWTFRNIVMNEEMTLLDECKTSLSSFVRMSRLSKGSDQDWTILRKKASWWSTKANGVDQPLIYLRVRLSISYKRSDPTLIVLGFSFFAWYSNRSWKWRHVLEHKVQL